VQCSAGQLQAALHIVVRHGHGYGFGEAGGDMGASPTMTTEGRSSRCYVGRSIVAGYLPTWRMAHGGWAGGYLDAWLLDWTGYLRRYLRTGEAADLTGNCA
jgi:hypothetical protein